MSKKNTRKADFVFGIILILISLSIIKKQNDMIKHIVFFGLAENAEGKTKAENAAIIKAELENLKHLIPGGRPGWHG